MRATTGDFTDTIYEYTLLPLRLHTIIENQSSIPVEVIDPLLFTHKQVMLRLRARPTDERRPYDNLLRDLHDDLQQGQPIQSPHLERHMINLLIQEMRRNDAPPEQFDRLDLK